MDLYFCADTHTHTIANSHAFSTLLENLHYAKRKGIRFLGMTDHGPKLDDSAHPWFFQEASASIPHEFDGVYILRGAEVNILDQEGHIDLDTDLVAGMDWVIASMHPTVFHPQTKEIHTQTWLNIAKDPNIDVIGHCGDGRFAFDHEPVIAAFKQYGKIVEVNEKSLKSRPGAPENCVEIMKLCAAYGVSVVLDSDSHFAPNIGEFPLGLEVIRQAGVPHSLIINADYDRFKEIAQHKTGRTFR